MSEVRSLRVIVLGATSAIAEQVARRYAEDGARLYLVARREDALSEVAADLTARGAREVVTQAMDLSMSDAIPDAFDAMVERLGGVDVVLLMYATLEEQSKIEADPLLARAELNTNLVSAAIWSLCAARVLERQKSGVLAVGGALAGDRGRQSNYVYGAAKSGIATLIEGIAHRLYGTGARALIVKMGPVATPLLPGGVGGAKPSKVARDIHRAIESSSSATLYAPGWWRFVMWPIRLAPDWIMHRTRL